MHVRNELKVMLIAATIATLAGCGSTSPSTRQAPPLDVAGVERDEIVDAARLVLSRMQFSIEKADPNAGVVTTKPLAGAQFFELWRSDNMTFRDVLVSNLHSIRRSVELTINQDRSPAVKCVVRVQRLSLPNEEVASVSQAYRIHSRSAPNLQTFLLTPRQQAEMAWIDQDNDETLAAEILRRVGNLITQRREEKVS